MQLGMALVLVSALLGGCVIYPTHKIQKSSEVKKGNYCIDLKLERTRDAFWSLGDSDLPIEPFELRLYKDRLIEYGIYSECPNPSESYVVKIHTHSGLRASAPRTYWSLFAALTFFIVPTTYEGSIDVEIARSDSVTLEQTRYFRQWVSLFMSYEAAKTQSQTYKDFGVRDVSLASTISDIGALILADLESKKTN